MEVRQVVNSDNISVSTEYHVVWENKTGKHEGPAFVYYDEIEDRWLSVVNGCVDGDVCAVYEK